MSALILSKKTGEVIDKEGWPDQDEKDAMFAGSGGKHAMRHFSSVQCIRKAITATANDDHATGGETKYFQFNDGENNLTLSPTTLEDMHNQLNQRGFAMDKTTGQKITMQQHNSIANVLVGVADMPLSAPTGHPEARWAEEAVSRFHSTLDRLLAEEDLED